jgi:hypothetical protein
LILFNFLVIKFPNPRFDWIRLSFGSLDRWTLKRFIESVLTIPKSIYVAFLYGISANINEGLFYWSNWFVDGLKSDRILVPVFTIGICNFQLYQGEIYPSMQELYEYMNSFPDARSYLMKCDHHDWAMDNWRKTENGLVLIDYALPALRSDLAYLLRAMLSQEYRQQTQKGRADQQE